MEVSTTSTNFRLTILVLFVLACGAFFLVGRQMAEADITDRLALICVQGGGQERLCLAAAHRLVMEKLR